MIPIKSEVEVQKMKEACYIAAAVLDELCQYAQIGMNTYDLDQYAKKLIEEHGAKSACYNHKVGNKRFPAYSCISVNHEVVHGIGSVENVLKFGDVVKLDVSIIYNGFVGDNARTIILGNVSSDVQLLVEKTKEALYKGIEQAKSGNRVGDISYAIQSYLEDYNLNVVRDFVGHGIGRSIHEEPQIPNFGRPHVGPKLKKGMTLAIEPMVNLGTFEIEYSNDGWTVFTKDRKHSAHFEHTVLVTEKDPEILTICQK